MKKLLLLLFPAAIMFSSSAFSEEGVATIISSGGSPAQCISPLLINNVDGQELAGGRTTITLSPGAHTINGAAQVNTSYCTTVGPSRGGSRSKTPPLEAEFEAGKTYWIGLNHKASRQSSWYYEIWKVEDSK
jgi:hypothetical protein